VRFPAHAARETLELLSADAPKASPNTAAMIETLQAVMADDVGPLRSAAKLERALATVATLTEELGDRPFGRGKRFDLMRLEWFDLRNMLTVARVVAEAALRRTESRGAHQREDFPDTIEEWKVNQVAGLRYGELRWQTVSASSEVAAL
jgi:succinate dehydrogenase/fumarate reductase flavoprotein subunit